MEWIYLDIFVIIILGFFTYSGFKNGVLKSFISLVGAILAVIFANYTADILSEKFYATFLKNFLISRVSDSISKGTLNIYDIFKNMPKIFVNFIDSYGINANSLNAVLSTKGVGASEQIIDLLSPITINIVKSIMFFVVFFIAMGLISIISKQISKFARVPIISEIDRVFGILFGFLKGYIIISVLMLALRIFISNLDDTPEIFTIKSIESTYVFSYVYKYNFAYGLINKLGI